MGVSGHIQAKVQEVFSAHSDGARLPSARQTIRSLFAAQSRRFAFFKRSRCRSAYIHFVRELQLQFGIYFSPDESVSRHTPEGLATLIEKKLRRNKAGALRLIEFHAHDGRYAKPFVLLNAILAVLLACVAKVSVTHACVAMCIGFFLNGLFAAVYLRKRNYRKKLVARIRQR